MIWSKSNDSETNKKISEINNINEEIAKCSKCNLCTSRNKTVPGEGNANANLFVIGEGPGEQNDIYGKPFIGRGGQILDKIFEEANIHREDLFLTNILKCRMPHNADPKSENITACKDYLIRQIDIIHPKFLIVLGLVAAKTLLNNKKMSLKDVNQSDFEFNGIPVLVTYHPSSIRYNANNRKHIIETFIKANDKK